MAPQHPRAEGAATEHLQGSVERVTFHSPESGFCVLRVKVRGQRELATVIGSAATIVPGEYVECAGAWTNDRQHGLQFKTEHLRVVPPTTLEGIEKYLGSGMVKGIGPHFARKLVRAFGEQVFEVIEQEPQRLLELEGIGFKTADAIAERLCIPHDALIRAQAGVWHVLQEISGDGHCAAYRENLLIVERK